MTVSKNNFFIGNKDEGNPYIGDLEQGIEYDSYEINFSLIEREGNQTLILPSYTAGARRLIRHLPIIKNQAILEIGSGTGISTLEVLLKNPDSFVFGIEISEGMARLAKYKFNQAHEDFSKIRVNDNLLKYFAKFRLISSKYRDSAKFIVNDFESVELEKESFDNALANYSLHWMNLSIVFDQLNKFLKKGASLAWNTSSHFYNDKNFPSLEYGFRYNDFLKYVLDEVNKSVNVVLDYSKLSNPKHNLESLNLTSSKSGFKVEHITTYLTPIDLQLFIKNHLFSIVSQVCDKDVDSAHLEGVTKRAIKRMINNPKATSDMKHKYEITPIFISSRI